MNPRRYRIGTSVPASAVRFVRDALEGAGWDETGGLDWSLYWDTSLPEASVFRQRRPGRLVNHLWGIGALTAKNGLAWTLADARRRLAARGLASLVDIAPRTYVMGAEHGQWRAEAAWNPDRIWILKPAALARGEGVRLVEDVAAVPAEDGWVVQEYVAEPHLLDGHKYTLRCYVLVTSLAPLEVYLFDEGFAKLASRPFTTDHSARGDRFVHLTNPDVLKHDSTTAVSAHNLTHAAFRERLRAEGVDDRALWAGIRRVIAAAVLAGCPHLRRAHAERELDPAGCFELLGLDVIVDRQLRPWLLECNLGPSLAVEADEAVAASRDERSTKSRVVRETLVLAGAIAGDAAGFTRVWPAPDTLPLLPCLQPLDAAEKAFVDLHARAAFADGHRWRPHGVEALPLGDRLALYAAGSGDELFVLNPVASFAWSSIADGVAVDAAARELAPLLDVGAETVAADLRSAAIDWIADGRLASADAEDALSAGQSPTFAAAGVAERLDWNVGRAYTVRGLRVLVRYHDVARQRAIHSVLADFETPGELTIDAAFDVCAGEPPIVASDGTPVRYEHPEDLAGAFRRDLDRRACAARGEIVRWPAMMAERRGSRVLALAGRGVRGRTLAARLRQAGWQVRERVPIVLKRAGPGLVVAGDGVGTEIGAIACFQWRATMEVIAPPELLARVLADAREGTVALDEGGARALVGWAREAPAYLCDSRDPAAALEAILSRPGSALRRASSETT